MATPSKGIRRDAFIKGVRPDPKSSEELIMLQGYIGDSDLPGHLRVYFDASLGDFIDLPEQEICYAQAITADEDPLGGSRLWVSKTTVFTTGDPRHANRIKSSFLEGDLVKAFGESGLGAQAIGQFGPGGGNNTLNPTCVSLGNTACISNNSPCRTVGICPQSLQLPCTGTITGTITGPVSIVAPSCFRTCLNPSCFRTCFNPTCFRTCFRTCQFICQIVVPQTRACQVFPGFRLANPADPSAQSEGYAGGFDPYNTANYGY